MPGPATLSTVPTSVSESSWLRVALDFCQQLLGGGDTDPRPWSILTEGIRRLVDADAVDVVRPSDDARVPVCAALGRVMALPLNGESGNLGVIEVRRRSDQPSFSDADFAGGRNLAQEVTRALELSDARAAQHRHRLHEDRERIARDLHDQVVQRLFATGLRLQSTVTTSKDATDRTRLSEVIDELDDTVRQIRTTIFALNCSGSSASSLRRTVLEVAESVGSAFGLRPTVCFRGPIDILVDPGVVRDVEAVVREGVTNAGKHAAASIVRIDLSASRAELRLLIEDDGVGLSGSSRHSGMGNLRRRAEQHGGGLVVDRSPLGGVRLGWSVPLT
ncbi:sensor histidine kinase [uncultured Friedmanniella sp.]|uniref:sensor histidine kinase n=1 Tax=uncultured Friedmanniella sp. TaxID=335381 RepID=UPI0035CB2FA5